MSQNENVVSSLCVAVCCSVLQCVAVCCSVLQCVVSWCSDILCSNEPLSQNKFVTRSLCLAVCCSMLKCVADLLQCGAVIPCLEMSAMRGVFEYCSDIVS